MQRSIKDVANIDEKRNVECRGVARRGGVEGPIEQKLPGKIPYVRPARAIAQHIASYSMSPSG